MDFPIESEDPNEGIETRWRLPPVNSLLTLIESEDPNEGIETWYSSSVML